jgi:zinc-ribbon domain
MFCPKCAAQNIDGAHFCRACGANISLVPQALTGQLPGATNDESSGRGRRRRPEKQPTFDEGVRNVVMGFGFIAVAIALAIFGRPIGAQVWWFWMLLPAFAMLGKGISEIVRFNQSKVPSPPNQPQMPYVAPREFSPPSNPGVLQPPVASVTEGTTRHLGTEAAARHFDQKS